MPKSERILFIADTKDYNDKLLLTDIRKRVKGFIRLGYDTQVFAPNIAIRHFGGMKNRMWVSKFYKPRMDELLVRQIKNYQPQIIYIGFAKYLDNETIEQIRRTAGNAVLIGYDVDIYPELHPGRVEAAVGLDILLTTYAGTAIAPYESRGVKCVFMPNICDPDIEYRYSVSSKWHSDILFTGKLKHKTYSTDYIRQEVLTGLSKYRNFVCYGSFGKELIGGLDYYYAISGARIGLSINADNNISLYHSDRLTHYLACGTLVIAKKVPDSERLFRDKEHLRYFETSKEFFELADWYLEREDERLSIANQGMEYVHKHYNCRQIAKYTMDVIQKGAYSAPWTWEDTK